MSKTMAELKESGSDISKLKPKERVAYLLESNKVAISQALPAHINADRLLRVAQTAVVKQPKLLEAYTPTLIGAVMQCAEMGLEPDTVLGQAYLVPFRNKQKKRVEVQVILGYQGLLDLARRSGSVKSVTAQAVHKADYFSFEYGTNQHLSHKPSFSSDRGDVIAFYAVSELDDGAHQFEVMSLDQVKLVMALTQSKGEYGPWKDNFEAMALKSVLRRLCKLLPRSAQLVRAAVLDSIAEQGKSQGMEHVYEGDFESVPDFEDEPEQEQKSEKAVGKGPGKKTAKKAGKKAASKAKPKPAEQETQPPPPTQDDEATEPGENKGPDSVDELLEILGRCDSPEQVNDVLDLARELKTEKARDEIKQACAAKVGEIIEKSGLE